MHIAVMWGFEIPECHIPMWVQINSTLHTGINQIKNRLQTHIIQYIISRTLGHSLTVELRTLTPSVLVRIQLPQPSFIIIKTICYII